MNSESFTHFVKSFLKDHSLVGDFARDFIADKKHHLRHSTLKSMETYLKNNNACDEAITAGISLVKMWERQKE